MYILGLQYDNHIFFHDSSAALIHNNSIIGHLEEERFTRKKHAINQFPINSIKKLLSCANIKFSDINVIVISNGITINEIITKLKTYFEFDETMITFDVCDHHISHLLNSYCYSNFKQCAALVVDGQGEQDDSITLASIHDGNITIIKKYDISLSLGYMYELASIWCNFDKFGCGKLMGLASFGVVCDIEPYFVFENGCLCINSLYKKTYDIICNILIRNQNSFNHYLLNFFTIQDVQNFNIYEKAIIVSMFKFFERIYPYKKCDNSSSIIYYVNFAATIQHIFNTIILYLVGQLKEITQSTNLILSGGCIQNCSANEKIINSKLFSNVYCSPSPYDSGGAIGNALYYALKHQYQTYQLNIHNAYTRNSYHINDIQKYKNDINIESISTKQIVNDLIDNKIIGWFQDGSEVGPRALCHRSIIANPSIRENLYIINTYIKGREQFRPLAPVVCDSMFFNVFETTTHDLSQFMLRTIKIRKQYYNKFSAVCHIDKTSRPQYLTYDTNPVMYQLITEFFNITGIPGLINTSFNRNNEPIVETIDDAIDMLLNTSKLNYIVFNSSIKISRK